MTCPKCGSSEYHVYDFSLTYEYRRCLTCGYDPETIRRRRERIQAYIDYYLAEIVTAIILAVCIAIILWEQLS